MSPNLASDDLRFEKCLTMILKYENTAQMWINREGMRSISQKMRVGPPLPPHTIKCAYLRVPLKKKNCVHHACIAISILMTMVPQ